MQVYQIRVALCRALLEKAKAHAMAQGDNPRGETKESFELNQATWPVEVGQTFALSFALYPTGNLPVAIPFDESYTHAVCLWGRSERGTSSIIMLTLDVKLKLRSSLQACRSMRPVSQCWLAFYTIGSLLIPLEFSSDRSSLSSAKTRLLTLNLRVMASSSVLPNRSSFAHHSMLR